MDSELFLSIIYLVILAAIFRFIKIPKTMLNAEIEMLELENLVSGEELKHRQLKQLIESSHSIRMTVWVIEKTLKVGLVAVCGAILFF